MMDENNIDSEDEDVVVQGSALYEHLHKSGCTDFEMIPVYKEKFKNDHTPKLADFASCARGFFKKLHPLYSWIMQEQNISKKQLRTILEVKALLSDHACEIHDFFKEGERTSLRATGLKLIFLGMTITSSMYIFLKTPYKTSASLFSSTTLLLASYTTYSRLCAHHDLKCLVSLQNDLFDLCKKGMKILQYEYKVKIGNGKLPQAHDLTAGRARYLQAIIEHLVKCLEHLCNVYYEISLTLLKLLPTSEIRENSLTRFEKNSFEVQGEINYQILSNLYHTYILVQSEMLYLLAVAYDSQTWYQSYSRIPELKLSRIIRSLIDHVIVHRNSLSEDINSYYSFRVEPVIHRKPVSSKWQDLHIHLNLTSNKLQLAYNHLLSIIEDINNDTNGATTDNETIENTMKKLNEAYKEIDTARNFAEFSSLLIAKARLNNCSNNCLDNNSLTPVVETDLPVITDTEPEIVDEVFEEYIKEEYLKPLYDESDESSMLNYKWDKFLAKNFMAELKEALIDKQKSMSERESKALQRMYNNILKDTDLKRNNQRIPTPPPLPKFNMPSAESMQTVLDQNKTHSEGKRYPKVQTFTDDDSSDEEICRVSFLPLPKIHCEMQSREFPLSLPTPFLKDCEETFVGSGENSEDELVESEIEDDQN